MERFQNILNFKLLNLGNVSISLYHFMIVALILLGTWGGIFIVRLILNNRWKSKNFGWGREYSLFQILKYFIWISIIIISLDTMGVELTLLLAGSAALLVGLGLGLQQTFNDIISGVILLWEGSINIDDVVEIEGTVGRVNSIGIRTSKLTTRDNIIIIIPNSKLVVDQVINWSHSEIKTRFMVSVGVAYGSDVNLVRKVLLSCALDHGRVSKTPTPFVRFIDFGNSSLDFQLFFWTEESFLVENLKSDLRFIIDKRFRENSITIPFPQRDLHFPSDFRENIGNEKNLEKELENDKQ